jgi:hypothetical protein
MGSITLSLNLLYLRSLAIVYEGGQACATFHTLPYRYLFSSYNNLIQVLSRGYQIICPLYPLCSKSYDIILFDTICYEHDKTTGTIGSGSMITASRIQGT